MSQRHYDLKEIIEQTNVKVLVYSRSDESLEDHVMSLRMITQNYDTANNLQDAKKLLKTGEFGLLVADVTDFEPSGKGLIRWAKNHIRIEGFRTFAYMRTDLPSMNKRVYVRGIDQRFYFDQTEVDNFAAVVYELLIDHPNFQWSRDMSDGQKRLGEKLKNLHPMHHPVLLNGPKGMGKECLAQIVHGMCNRCENEFVILDCNPRQKYDYAARENRDTWDNREKLRQNFKIVFGRGYRGTVYIRSFTHLSAMAQAVLEEVLASGKCLLPVIGDKKNPYREVEFEGRIIFANNKDLSELVEKRKVNDRLYKRLVKNSMDIQPLAHYGDEILSIAQAIVGYLCLKGRGREMVFTEAAKELIKKFAWPGNIEEMVHVLRVAVASARLLRIDVVDLSMINDDSEISEIEIVEPTKENIERLLRENNGNKSKVHKLVGLSRTQFYRTMKKLDIPNDFK